LQNIIQLNTHLPQSMSLVGILSSPSQRRTFLLVSGLIILISAIVIWGISKFAPDTRGWNGLFSLLISMLDIVYLATSPRLTCPCD
jgi:hypothetical protein